MTADRLADLSAAGVSIWLDDLDRARLTSGGLAALVADSFVVGVTTNPSIFEKAIVGGAAAYADQVHDLAVRGVDIGEAIRSLTAFDVRWACDVLARTHAATGGVDGRVSIEVDPRLARDTEATIAEAKALHWAVDRPNVLIKIPATVEGLPAITAVLGAGISVNVTLIFSVDRYRAVLDAWLAGLELARANGHNLSEIESVASFFVSRVDTEADRRLADDSPLRGKVAVANAKVAYQRFLERFAGPRWDALAAKGARLQRPLWASTSTKNPAYSDTLYVDELVGPDTVNTLAQGSIDALRDHGDPKPDTITADVADALAVITGLADAGVDYDDVTATIEREGVASFAGSYADGIATLDKRAKELLARP